MKKDDGNVNFIDIIFQFLKKEKKNHTARVDIFMKLITVSKYVDDLYIN